MPRRLWRCCGPTRSGCLGKRHRQVDVRHLRPGVDELLDLVALEIPVQNSNPDLSIQHAGSDPDKQVAVRPAGGAAERLAPLDHCCGTMVILAGAPLDRNPSRAGSMASRENSSLDAFAGPAGTGQCVDISSTAIDMGLGRRAGIVAMRKLAGLNQAADNRYELLKDDPCLYPAPRFRSCGWRR